jgi:2-(1,2-epoxy-1,2-dihydrophenyl)acetyl-CoA isomerase
MSTSDVFVVETEADGVLLLELVDPKGRNPLSMPMREQLLRALQKLDGRTDLHAAILASREKNFSVGGDVSSMGAHNQTPWRQRLQLTSNVAMAMAQNSKPIIAAVEGWAAGGGMSLALLCDTIVASESARFKAAFGDIGLIGDVGVLHTLPARVGVSRAKQIMLYSETIGAQEARTIGLVDHLCPPGKALEEARSLAAKLASKGPLAIRVTKAILSEGLESYLAREREIQEWLANTEDHAEGQRAFMEKRRPNFKSR